LRRGKLQKLKLTSALSEALNDAETRCELANFDEMKRNRKTFVHMTYWRKKRENEVKSSPWRFNDEFMASDDALAEHVGIQFYYSKQILPTHSNFSRFSFSFLCRIHRDNMMNRDVNSINAFAVSWL
jgi:hypothetical protein